jgi:hypothetical protein
MHGTCPGTGGSERENRALRARRERPRHG